MAFRVLARIVAIGALSIGVFAPAVSTAQTTTYTYDAQGQVRAVTRPSQTVTYAYDAAANRTAVTAAAPPAGLTAGGASMSSLASSSMASASPPERPAFAPPPTPTDMVKLLSAPQALPPAPISPLTGQPLPAAAPSSSR